MAGRNKQKKSWYSAINSYCQTLLLGLIHNNENLRKNAYETHCQKLIS